MRLREAIVLGAILTGLLSAAPERVNHEPEMVQSTEEVGMNPLWNGILGAVLGATVVVVYQSLIYKQHKLSDKRDVLFKCFEGYVKAKEYHSIALSENKYEDFHKYFRTLLDLQWVEYQLWQDGIIQRSVYEAWLFARWNDYNAPEVMAKRYDSSLAPISYRLVWEELTRNNYWSARDPFRNHMELTHMGRIEDAVRTSRRVLGA